VILSTIWKSEIWMSTRKCSTKITSPLTLLIFQSLLPSKLGVAVAVGVDEATLRLQVGRTDRVLLPEGYIQTGLPDGIFSNQKPHKFWCVLQWKMLVYLMDIRPILQAFDMFYGHLVYFVVIWYIFPRFGMLYQEKSGNPAHRQGE
jgi:hypothetical protein